MNRVEVVLGAFAPEAPTQGSPLREGAEGGGSSDAFAPNARAPGSEGSRDTSPRLEVFPGEVDWLGTYRTMAAAGTRLARVGLFLGVWMAWLAPVWMTQRLRTLGSLAPAERASILNAMSRHRSYAVRELTLLLKIVASMALLGVPSVRARSGYDREEAPVRIGAAS